MNITDDMLYRHAGEARDIWLSACVPLESRIPDHQFSARFNRRMKRLIAEQRRDPTTNRVLLYARKAVAAILIASAVSFAGLMTVEAYREKFIEIVTHICNELTEYRFSSDAPDEDVILLPAAFTYLPAGMEIAAQDVSDNYFYIRYEGSDGRFFELTQTLITAETAHNKILDTEGSSVERFYIHGEDATASSKDDDTIIIWTNGSILNDLFGNVSLEELKAVAAGVK